MRGIFNARFYIFQLILEYLYHGGEAEGMSMLFGKLNTLPTMNWGALV